MSSATGPDAIAGALSKNEYEAGLTAAGFTDISVTFTHQVGDGLHSAIIKATKPVDTSQPNGVTASAGQAALLLAPKPAAAEPPGRGRRRALLR
jgi:arsenite methyltransferase